MDFNCRYDVAVAGAGIAGIAAAVAAARQGKKVALVEKQTLIGGLATSGLIFVFLFCFPPKQNFPTIVL